MRLKQDLYDYLNANAGVIAQFSDSSSPTRIRVFPNVLPQEVALPAGTYQFVGVGRQPLADATTDDVVRTSVNFDVYAINSVALESASDALREALQDFRGLMGGTQVARILLENEIDLTDVEPGLFRNSMSFTIWHDEV